jgi:hypothetical protein
MIKVLMLHAGTQMVKKHGVSADLDQVHTHPLLLLLVLLFVLLVLVLLLLLLSNCYLIAILLFVSNCALIATATAISIATDIAIAIANVIATTTNLGDNTQYLGEPPDNIQGYGRIQLDNILPLAPKNIFDLYLHDGFGLAENSETFYKVYVSDSSIPLK